MTAPGGGNYNANVVLTADTSQYNQQVNQSTQQTNRLTQALNQVTGAMDGLAHRAGRKLFQFTAADFAVLGTATATAATFEKQLSTLRATADISGDSFKSLKANIENTFQSFPVARGQVIQLTETITNLGVTGTKTIGSLVNTFTKLGAATGEGPNDLASGLTQLSRLMGTTNAQQIGNYANALLTVSKSAGVSSTGVLNFAQAIAPLARQAGIGESAVLGISTAFSKAGADGFVAANTFNSLVSNITNLTQTGSPELEKYANLIGKTTTQFKQMDKTTALTDIFEAIAKQGPKAIQTLNQLGIDGVRAQSAIAAVVQTGGLRQAIAKSVDNSGNQKNLNKASADAMGGLSDELVRLRNNFTQLGTEIGTTFLTPLEKVMSIFNSMFETLNKIIKPFTPIIAAVGALAGALTGLGGAALLTFGIVSKLATLKLFATGAPLAAFKGGMQTGRDPLVSNVYSDRYASRTLPYYQRPFYAAGSGVGRILGPGDPNGGQSLIGRGAAMGVQAPFVVARTLTDATTRTLQQATLPAEERGELTRPGTIVGNFGRRLREMRQGQVPSAAPVPASVNASMTQSGMLVTDRRAAGGAVGFGGAAKDAEKEAARTATAMGTAAKATEVNAVRTAAASTAQAENASVGRVLARESAALAGSFARLGAQTLATGASMVGGGLVRAGKGIFGALGPVGIGLLGAPVAFEYGQKLGGYLSRGLNNTDPSGSGNAISKYDQLLGMTSSNLAKFSTAVQDATNKTNANINTPTTIQGASQVTSADITQSRSGTYKVTDSNLKMYGQSGDINAGVQYLKGLSLQSGGLDSKKLSAIKRDLIATYGADKAQSILNAYVNSAGGSAVPNIDFGTLGAGINGKSQNDAAYKGAIGQAFSVANSRYQLNQTPQAARAQLASILTLSNSIVGGTASNAEQFAGQLSRIYGGDKNDYTGARGIAPNGRNSETAVRRQVISSLLLSSSARKSLTAAGLNLPSYDKFVAAGGTKAETTMEDMVLRQLRGQSFPNPINSSSSPLAQMGALTTILKNPLLQRTTGVGSAIGDPKQQVAAQEMLIAKTTSLTGNTDKAADALRKIADTAANVDPALQALAQTAAEFTRSQYESTVVPTMNRQQQTQYYAGRVSTTKAQMDATGTDQARTDYQQAVGQYNNQQEANRQYLIGVYQQVKNYNTQMQRSYQDYYKSVYRQERDFGIQMEHAERDYQKQRYRMQRDFNIQMEQQAVQSAQSIYNPFQRVFDQQTADAGTVLQNLQDQNGRIQNQLAELQRLKQMGVSQQTIDILNLADPQNAQELDNMIQGITNNPTLVKAINGAVAKRAKATTALTQSDFNVTFRNTVDAFHRQFSDMAQDFNTQRNDAEEAEQRGLADMAQDFSQMVQRSVQDMQTALTEITGSFDSLMKKTFIELGKNLGKQVPGWTKIVQNGLDSLHVGANAQNGDNSGSSGGTTMSYGTGSASNPYSRPNVHGVNSKGQVGYYDTHGHFHAQDTSNLSGPALAKLEKTHIISPTASAGHNSAQTPAGAQKYAASRLHAYGWGQEQMAPLIKLWNNESGWRYTAYNSGSGATGIPQALPGNKMASAGADWKSNGATQIEWGLGYIKGRYGSPQAASNFEFSHSPHWYDHGGVLKPGITQTVNMTGKPEFILTPDQMKAFHTVGLGNQATNVYKVFNDMSNTFTGITVMAQDPNAMAKALKQKARIARLSTPPRSTAGAA